MSRGANDDAVFVSAGPPRRRKCVAFGVPTLGRVSMRWVKSHYELSLPTNASVVHVYVEGREVGEARNEIVARTLAMETDEREMTHVFFLDDDVLPHPEAFKKLFAVRRPIVSGLYFLKYQTPTPMVLHEESEGVAVSWRPGDIIDCAAHGMGLTLIELDVFRRMRDELDLGVDDQGYPAWFKTLRDQHLLGPHGENIVVNETEDVYFLKRARQLGYQPCVDTSAQAFGWHWHQREQRAYPLKQWTEWQTRGTISWDTDAGVVVWENAA